MEIYINDKLFADCPDELLPDLLSMMSEDGFDTYNLHRSVNNHLRQRIYRQCGVVDCPENSVNLEDLMQTEWNAEFENLMRNRLLMGALRYGLMKDPEKAKYNYLEAMEDKIKQYRITGNDELLVDIGNYALLEFTLGRHPNKHFKATDDKNHAKLSS